MKKINDTCEIWNGTEWDVVSVKEAKDRGNSPFRCIECKGRIRLYYAGPAGIPRAHAEHIEQFSGCSFSQAFDGKQRENPSKVLPPNITVNPRSKIPEEVFDNEFTEGTTKKILVNRFERSSSARKECLAHYGPECTVCGNILSSEYGEIAEGFIHIHHLVPLHTVKTDYEVDPIKDLRPVCPNCHAIIHLKDPPLSIEEVQLKFKQMRRGPESTARQEHQAKNNINDPSE